MGCGAGVKPAGARARRVAEPKLAAAGARLEKAPPGDPLEALLAEGDPLLVAVVVVDCAAGLRENAPAQRKLEHF